MEKEEEEEKENSRGQVTCHCHKSIVERMNPFFGCQWRKQRAKNQVKLFSFLLLSSLYLSQFCWSQNGFCAASAFVTQFSQLHLIIDLPHWTGQASSSQERKRERVKQPLPVFSAKWLYFFPQWVTDLNVFWSNQLTSAQDLNPLCTCIHWLVAFDTRCHGHTEEHTSSKIESSFFFSLSHFYFLYFSRWGQRQPSIHLTNQLSSKESLALFTTYSLHYLT